MKGGDRKLALVQISYKIVTQELKFSDNSSTLQIAQYMVELRICATWFRRKHRVHSRTSVTSTAVYALYYKMHNI